MQDAFKCYFLSAKQSSAANDINSVSLQSIWMVLELLIITSRMSVNIRSVAQSMKSCLPAFFCYEYWMRAGDDDALAMHGILAAGI